MTKPALDSILACPKLPSLPSVAVEVLELTSGGKVDLGKVAASIRVDQALATRVLRTVNWSYYGLVRPCTTIHQAMAYLGVNTVTTIVLGFCVADCLGGREVARGGFDYAGYWRRALFSAAAARQIALRTGACAPEEVFLAALTQDVGMIALHRALGKEYVQILHEAGEDHRRLDAIEREALQVDHAEIGAALARVWKLPELLAETIRCHHRAEDAPERWAPFARAVELGGLVAASLTVPRPDSAITMLMRRAGQWFGLAGQESCRLIRTVGETTAELSNLFNLPTGPRPDIETIMLAAEECLVQHELELERQSAELRKAAQMLAHQALADPLTGLANRRHFDEELQRRFEQARQFKACLGLIFCDVDRFKACNDAHGHQVGDAVLGHIAMLMQKQVGDRGLAARCGGEEFAVILPGCDRVQSTRIAEELRCAVEGSPVDLRDLDGPLEALSVTVSLGVAAYETAMAEMVTGSQMIVRLADQAVEAAKAAGRNCVRVFTPVRKRPRVA